MRAGMTHANHRLPRGPASRKHIREESLHFARWFASSRYRLMAEFLTELEEPASERATDALRDRYCRALAHGQRVMRARAFVTALLALGVIATAVTAVMRLVALPGAIEADVAATQDLLDRLAAYSASAAVLLVGLRMAFDRYLERVDVTATFLAIQLATCER